MLTVEVPPGLAEARKYAVQVLIGQFLGLEYELRTGEPGCVRLVLDDHPIEVADVFFMSAESSWLSQSTIPSLPLSTWNPSIALPGVILAEQAIPVLFGQPYQSNTYLDLRDDRAWLGLDVFGSAFFMLSRYEEVVGKDRDTHDRFPSHASIAAQAGFLHRPIVNEYLEILWSVMCRIWPKVPPRRKRHFRVIPSHDVDSPYYYAFTGPLRAARRFAGDISIRSMSPAEAFQRLRNWHRVRRGQVYRDPHDTFDQIMDSSEAAGLRSSFYFICGHTGGKIDGDYSIDDPRLRQVIRRIHDRGHEIGIHPSYNTYLQVAALRAELDALKRVCIQENIAQESFGGRQHFLRWRTPNTFRNWENVGLTYDSTLSFADRAGFRCGTCYEYTTFDVENQKILRLHERPLVIMECSIIDERYLGLGTGDAAADYIQNLKRSCRLFNGDFSLLWHNSRLVDSGERRLFREALVA